MCPCVDYLSWAAIDTVTQETSQWRRAVGGGRWAVGGGRWAAGGGRRAVNLTLNQGLRPL